MSFIAIHYALFIAIPLITSIVFWAISLSKQHVSYTDSLFLCISALTEAGLNPVNLSSINTGQQIILLLLTIVGSPLVTSAAVLVVRKNTFEKRFSSILEGQSTDTLQADGHQCRTKRTPQAFETSSICSTVVPSQRTSQDGGKHSAASDSPRPRHDTLQHLTNHTSSSTLHDPIANNDTVGTKPNDKLDEEQLKSSQKRFPKLDKYLDTAHGYIGRNSAIKGLSYEEKCALGGVEYRAITFLCWIVPVYIIMWQLLGVVALGTWCHVYLFDASTQNGLNAFWNGAFFAVSAFNNSGLALLDVNATAFQTSYFPLLSLSLLMLAGNTCFPPFLRLTMWFTKRCIPRTNESYIWQERRKTVSFILDHPRRVYTHLFPSFATWWVVVTLFLLNGTDWLAFELFNINNPVVDSIPLRYRVLDGLFQAFAVRVGGFAVVDISGLRPALLTLYVVMMYISVYPIAMAIRSTNVYEEQSLGIFPEDSRNEHRLTKDNSKDRADGGRDNDRSNAFATFKSLLRTFAVSTTPPQYSTSNRLPRSFLHHQLAIQLSHDLWWIAAAVIIIQLVETSQTLSDPVTFSTFNMLFEVVSAYGTVGISTGVPWDFYSFCGAWHTTSKLVLCAVMLRGRHRGLPVEVDKAIILPGADVVDEPGPISDEVPTCECGIERMGASVMSSASEETVASVR